MQVRIEAWAAQHDIRDVAAAIGNLDRMNDPPIVGNADSHLAVAEGIKIDGLSVHAAVVLLADGRSLSSSAAPVVGHDLDWALCSHTGYRAAQDLAMRLRLGKKCHGR